MVERTWLRRETVRDGKFPEQRLEGFQLGVHDMRDECLEDTASISPIKQKKWLVFSSLVNRREEMVISNDIKIYLT